MAKPPRTSTLADPVLAKLDALKADLHAIVRRLDAIESRLGPSDGSG